MAKATGYEIVDFYSNGWPEGYYSDESELSVTDSGEIVVEGGPENQTGLPLAEKYDLSRFGCIISEKGDVATDFSYFFNRWKRHQTTTTIVVQVAKSDEAGFRDLMKINAIKIIG